MQASVIIEPVKDNTLYDNTTPSSNGIGTGLFCGVNNQGRRRRGLVAFDVAAVIPRNAVILSASLSLELTQTSAGDLPVSLHRAVAEWGEGTSLSVGAGGGGGGASATTNDATWSHRFFPTQFWSIPGGDFAAVPSATTTVGAALTTYTFTSLGMVSDVQLWIDSPTLDFGWVLKSPEASSGNAKRFGTRESTVPSARPRLEVTFIPYPGSSEDLLLATGVNGPSTTAPIKAIAASDSLSVKIDSPSASYWGHSPFLVGQLFLAVAPLLGPVGFPEIHLDPTADPAPIVIFDGNSVGPTPTTLAPGGLDLFYAPIPMGLGGLHLLMQALVFDSSAVNGIFAVTDGHEIVFL